MKAIQKHLLVALIFCFSGVAYLNAQPTIKGKVTDSDGLPLPGVTVLVRGTTNGTMTDNNGYYTYIPWKWEKCYKSVDNYLKNNLNYINPDYIVKIC